MSDHNKLTIGGVTYIANNIDMTDPEPTPQQFKINYIVNTIKKILNNATHTIDGWLSSCKGVNFNIEYTAKINMCYTMTMVVEKNVVEARLLESRTVFHGSDIYDIAAFLYVNRAEHAYLTYDEQNVS